MYELLILSALLSRDMSGYKLRNVLSNRLVPRRKLSNGVLYPLLNKLENAGYIEMSEDNLNPRGEKLAHLTAAGKRRFQELMRQPVVPDAKSESMHQFKLAGLGGVDASTQLRILDEYAAQVQGDLHVYQAVREHLAGKQRRVPAPTVAEQTNLFWNIQSLILKISLCETRMDWIAQARLQIKQGDSTTNDKDK